MSDQMSPKIPRPMPEQEHEENARGLRATSERASNHARSRRSINLTVIIILAVLALGALYWFVAPWVTSFFSDESSESVSSNGSINAPARPSGSSFVPSGVSGGQNASGEGPTEREKNIRY